MLSVVSMHAQLLTTCAAEAELLRPVSAGTGLSPCFLQRLLRCKGFCLGECDGFFRCLGLLRCQLLPELRLDLRQHVQQ